MFFQLFLIFCAFLPFQFALNPAPGIDLAVIRIIIPLLFLYVLFLLIKDEKKILSRKGITCLIAAFLLLAAFSLFFSDKLSWSYRKLLFLFSIFPVYLVSIGAFSLKKNTRKVLIALVFGASATALLAIIQFVTQFFIGIDSVYGFFAKHAAPFFLGNSFSEAVLTHSSWLVNSAGTTYMRAFAFFPDPHMFSYYLGMLLPFSIALWITSSSHKKLFFTLSVLLIVADMLSFTRGGYVALISGCLVALPLVPKQAVKKLAFAATFLFIMFFAVPHSPVSQRFVSSFDPIEGSNATRMENWLQALSVIANNPAGTGIGTYSLAIDPDAAYRTPIYAHNLYLDIAAELGIFAAIIFIAILWLAFNSFRKAGKREPFFIAGASSITIFAVHSIVETPLYSVHVLTLFLIIVALAATLKKYEKNNNN